MTVHNHYGRYLFALCLPSILPWLPEDPFLLCPNDSYFSPKENNSPLARIDTLPTPPSPAELLQGSKGRSRCRRKVSWAAILTRIKSRSRQLCAHRTILARFGSFVRAGQIGCDVIRQGRAVGVETIDFGNDLVQEYLTQNLLFLLVVGRLCRFEVVQFEESGTVLLIIPWRKGRQGRRAPFAPRYARLARPMICDLS